MGWGGSLLHSHVQTFPVGSIQQQGLCYRPFFLGGTNQPMILTLKFVFETRRCYPAQSLATFTRNLHSHNVMAPVTMKFPVMGMIQSDHWQVEVVDDVKQGEKVDHIHSLTTRLRFRHQVLGCYLRAANVNLPQWGFKQVEVTCDKDNNPQDTHTYWNVENHWNDRRKLFSIL